MLSEFEYLLKRAMGLDAASIGSSFIERAVQERMTACRLDDLRSYWELVMSSESELQELIETVVVPETWFFRDREAFVGLARIAQESWSTGRSRAPLRLLSLPSATGEEPYSMVMALLDAGLTTDQFHIDAVDISRRALERAERAVYGKNSFRGDSLDFRERYFETGAQGYQLNEHVRRQVRFYNDNFFASDFLQGQENYDIIFCRNLLIYFDRTTQDRAIQILEGLLRPQGLLFVAASETGLMLRHDFVSANLPLAFAFHRPSTEVKTKRGKAQSQAKVVSRRTHQSTKPAAKPKSTQVRPAKARPASAALPVTSVRESKIAEAARLADRGRFAEAAKYCEEELRENGPSAAVFHLMGLVREATGDAVEATGYYRKALYLDPDHYETLIHLALLIEKQGGATGAQALRERARRVKQKRKVPA